jgi:hypothetical protein
MNMSIGRAAILVMFIVAVGCAPRVRVTSTTPQPEDKLAQLWQAPQDLAARDLFYGVGGAEKAPAPDAPFTWVATDTKGYSPGFTVRDTAGRTWDAKLGPEAQSEVVASRVLWAIGYHQPAVYYLPNWQLAGGPGGQQGGARFRLDDADYDVVGEWSWADNEFIGTQPFHGLITTNILLNSWDWKTSNNKIYRRRDGAAPVQRHIVRDLGASLGKTAPSRLLWVLPISVRGFGQGSRNNIDDFESHRLIKQFDENDVDFEFHTIYGSVVNLVRPSDVRWTAQLLSRVSDAQWDDAFRAADYSPEVRARYIKKIKAKIAEGLAVS